MSFPLYYILIIYLVFLFIWTLFSLVGIYHMLKYGFRNSITFLIIVIYISMSVFLISISFKYLIEIDWQVQVSILDSFFNTNLPFQ
jgi:hypothetical protein